MLFIVRKRKNYLKSIYQTSPPENPPKNLPRNLPRILPKFENPPQNQSSVIPVGSIVLFSILGTNPTYERAKGTSWIYIFGKKHEFSAQKCITEKNIFEPKHVLLGAKNTLSDRKVHFRAKNIFFAL